MFIARTYSMARRSSGAQCALACLVYIPLQAELDDSLRGAINIRLLRSKELQSRTTDFSGKASSSFG